MARGSKPGEHRGGRKAGMPNRKTAETQAAVAASGITPLDYMLSVMRDTAAEPDRRDDMAKAAAPYVHAKLAAIEHSGGIAHSLTDMTDAQLAAIASGGGVRTAAPKKSPRRSR
jgi:hypothetical protein